MPEFIKWLTDKFKQPLPLLFFALGAVLLLLGVTTGLDLPVLRQLTPDVRYRWVSLASGAAFLLLAVFLYYFPPKPVSLVRPKLEGEASTDTIERFARLEQNDITSPTQRRILALMLEAVSADQIRSADEIRKRIREKIDTLRKSSDAELYYRLEQLFWMGFLTKKTIGRDNFLYGVSGSYQQYLKSQDKRLADERA